MECKYRFNRHSVSILSELIDTLWNVNKDMVFKSNNEFRELIDTLWNVNER